MNIAIIEILALEGCRWIDHLYNLLITRQFTSIMPQVVAVWCRYRPRFQSLWRLPLDRSLEGRPA